MLYYRTRLIPSLFSTAYPIAYKGGVKFMGLPALLMQTHLFKVITLHIDHRIISEILIQSCDCLHILLIPYYHVL